LTVPPTGASDQNPAFSPDGSHLVFTRFDEGYNDGPAGLFLFDLDSSQSARLTPVEDQDNVNLPGSAWNVTNDRIVFSSDRMEADDLWFIAPDGGDLSRITVHSGSPWYFEPSWSPDGQWVVFEASRPGGSEDGRVSEIWKVRGDGTGLTCLTTGFDDRQPNWSPAGDRILFQRRVLPDGLWDIYAIGSDGGDLQDITDSAGIDETDASWSPGGKCIVYSTDGGDLPVPNIFVLAVDGGLPIQITFSDSYEDSAPSWSPDGGWIAFESRESSSEDAPAALWRIAVPENACEDAFRIYVPYVNSLSGKMPICSGCC
jgi:TolB protein